MWLTVPAAKHQFDGASDFRKDCTTIMKLLILDGNSILNRAFYGIKLLTTRDGQFTNAVYGFFTMLQRLLDETKPDHVAAAFDLKAPTFRHKAYAGYKAQRKGMPPELAQQLPVVKELLQLLGYRIVECEGYEADDILGTLARACQEQGCECVIATGDRDSLQLVAPGVTVRIAATKMGKPEVTLYDDAAIREAYGLEPKQLIDVKALQGDSSDNIPGVPGIGQKGALSLVKQFGSLDEIYAHLDSPDLRDSMRKKLIEGKESALMSRMLGTICTEAPIDTKIETYAIAPAQAKEAAQLLAKLECFSLIDKLGLRSASAASAPSAKAPAALWAAEICEDNDLPELLQTLRSEKRVCFLSEVSDGRIDMIRIAQGKTVWKITRNSGGLDRFLAEWAADASIEKVTHDIKPFFAALKTAGIPCCGKLFDTALAAYLLNPSASGYELSRLAEQDGLLPALPENASSADCSAAALPALSERLALEIAQNDQQELLEKIEIPLARVLAEMELAGFEVDGDGVSQYGEVLALQIELLQKQIYESVGYEFNINSPKQLGEALFEKLALPYGKKTKTGYSTSAEILENLRDEHPAVAAILEYRTLSKLKSTYCDGLTKVIAADGRIHSSFNQTETRTGRISSTEPNLQNIPTRTDVGRELRRFFRAQRGWTLIDADYSQIELRVLAHVANDQTMIDAFLNHEDIHRTTASQVFNLPPELITPLLRSRAKAVNFGIVYGISAFSLAKDIHVSRAEADAYIKGYMKHYTGVAEYMRRIVAEARENGFAETMFGRRRYLPELASSNFNLRSFGERVARNMPIQGTAADIIKIAMIRVSSRLREEGLRSRLILQVHDELIVEAPEEEAVRAAEILQNEMEHAVELSVPLTVDVHLGKTWFETKE